MLTLCSSFDLVSTGCFVFFLGMFLPFNYIILEAVHYGMSPNLAQYLPSILNAASIFGRTVPGYYADKIGRFNMMIVMSFFTGKSSECRHRSLHSRVVGIILLALWLPGRSNAPIVSTECPREAPSSDLGILPALLW